MKSTKVFAVCIGVIAGCATLKDPPNGVTDIRGNLIGDHTRTYMDIVQAAVRAEGTDFAFSVETVSRMPSPAEFAGGKRVDFIWFVDADRNTKTGQNETGNDYNIHLYMDAAGWNIMVIPVSELASAHGNLPRADSCRYTIDGTTLTVYVPQRTFPDAHFDWWAWSMTGNAPDWPPYTENPVTKRTSTR
ncbi:MAG: hypothetical protein HUU46_02120 [Candidatus Hydrogenedentes bacterium]|nr:hypothetical protein [Candidatus Hydrogenedentota bacterium]